MTVDHRADHEAYVRETLEAWVSLLENLFPEGIPQSYTWTNIAEIVSVLNRIGKEAPENHMFFPNGGGMDLDGAGLHHEPGTIELWAGFTTVVKPKSLTFEYFGPESVGWTYFRLETAGLKPTGVYTNGYGIYEEVTELAPGRHAKRSLWDAGYDGYDADGNERPLPQTARCISRYFEGAFVIFPKGSIYNQISDTYDGRHNKMSPAQFKKFIAGAALDSQSHELRPRYR